jgi:hypothetical protein
MSYQTGLCSDVTRNMLGGGGLPTAGPGPPNPPQHIPFFEAQSGAYSILANIRWDRASASLFSQRILKRGLSGSFALLLY